MNAVTLNFRPLLDFTDDQFYQLCQSNPDAKLERTATGEIVIMSPTGGHTGNKNLDILGQLWVWISQNRELGFGFDSSTGFKLPNGALRSPDASWIKLERWESLTPDQRRKFPPLAPDFVVEVKSVTDSVEEVRVKMREYRDNGVRLGWLINPQDKIVEIYRLLKDVEVLESPLMVLGEDVLPGFVLDLKRIFT